jgi:hypothetical protein
MLGVPLLFSQLWFQMQPVFLQGSLLPNQFLDIIPPEYGPKAHWWHSPPFLGNSCVRFSDSPGAVTRRALPRRSLRIWLLQKLGRSRGGRSSEHVLIYTILHIHITYILHMFYIYCVII